MRPFVISSCQAPIADPLCAAIATYLDQSCAIPAQFRGDIPWQERNRLFDHGAIDVLWLCGAPYIRKMARRAEALELLAAPVMRDPRYHDQPIYFSDVMVRADAPYQRFADLRGARWAYNETGSQSGYHIVTYTLQEQGLNGTFFGTVVESGSHQRSLALIIAGDVDAAAIDSTVLEHVALADPVINGQVRAIAAWGPSPMPPWVIGTHVAPELRQRLQRALTQMHTTAIGAALLGRYGVARFERVTDAHYDPIRTMLAASRHVRLAARSA